MIVVVIAKDHTRTGELRMELKALYGKHGFKLRNMFLPMIAQIPGFILFFTSLRYMLDGGFYPELVTGNSSSLLFFFIFFVIRGNLVV
jgi:membrane protein insertase Oxa1/YidC/SpoIIIJ